MKIIAHLIAHGYIRYTEQGQTKIEDQRPQKEIPKVVLQTIFFEQLPHKNIGDSHDESSKHNILSASSPFGLGVVGNKAHYWIGNGIEKAGEEEDE